MRVTVPPEDVMREGPSGLLSGCMGAFVGFGSAARRRGMCSVLILILF